MEMFTWEKQTVRSCDANERFHNVHIQKSPSLNTVVISTNKTRTLASGLEAGKQETFVYL